MIDQDRFLFIWKQTKWGVFFANLFCKRSKFTISFGKVWWSILVALAPVFKAQFYALHTLTKTLILNYCHALLFVSVYSAHVPSSTLCQHVIPFDGLQDGILNMSSFLIGHDVLRDYLFNFLHGRLEFTLSLHSYTVTKSGLEINTSQSFTHNTLLWQTVLMAHKINNIQHEFHGIF